MAGRICGTCGAPVPVLADLCPGCGADPELQLVEIGALELGRRRRGPPPDSSDPPRDRRRWWPLLTGAAVVAILVGVLATAPEDEAEGEEATPPTPTTRAFEREGPERPRRSTTTSTTRPPGPLLGEPTGLLLAAGGTRAVLDLDTGDVLELRATVLGGHGGRLLVSTGADLAWWPAPFDGTGAELLAEGVQADQAWIAADGTAWLLRWDGSGGPEVTAIGPGGGRADLELPVSYHPVGTVGRALVIGLPGGTFAVDADGSARFLSTGAPVAAAGDRAFVTSCDETFACEVRVLDGEGEVVDSFPSEPDALAYGQGLASADGRLALLEGDPDGSMRVRVGDQVLEGTPGRYVNGLAWSPDGRWLFLNGDRDMRAWEVDTGRTVEIDIRDARDQLQSWPLLVVGR